MIVYVTSTRTWKVERPPRRLSQGILDKLYQVRPMFLLKHTLINEILEDQAPVDGEDFQAISDDYQRLIEPGDNTEKVARLQKR